MASESALTTIGDPGRRRAARLGQRLAFEQRDLAGQAQQRAPGVGRPARLDPADQHLPDVLLERLDPLAHGRRRHVQRPGGRVEAALLHDGGQRRELLGVQRRHKRI